jgi:TRAP-type mannitol/chloroaromatic compound transport system substrate-binding protein
MQNMKKKKMYWGMLALILVSFFIVQVAPVNAADKIELKMSSVWSSGIQLIECDRNFVKLVNAMGGDNFKIKFFDGGTMVPSFELFDAVARGTLDMGGDWGGYWPGKDEAFNVIGSQPMGLSINDYMLWIYQGGGFDLIQEAYAKHGIVALPFGGHGSESGIRGNKPINSLKDLKGMKIRMGGKLQGKILKDFGAVQVNLAGSEVYQALEKGVIDACEYNIPTVDSLMGLQEITKYWASPAWHAPAAIFSVLINKNVWDTKLTPGQREMLKTAAMANFLWSFTFFEYNDIAGTKKFLDKKIKITKLSDKDLEAIQQSIYKHTLEACKTNPLFAKIAYSQYKFLQDFAQWRSVASPFSHGRNVTLPDMNAIKAAAGVK